MGTGAHHAVTSHPFHFAMVLLVQPGLQARLFRAKIGIADTDLLKAEFQPPLFDFQGKLRKIERMRHD